VSAAKSRNYEESHSQHVILAYTGYVKQQTEVSYAFQPGPEAVDLSPVQLPRVGIYSGSFDPVHAGHIVFALKSQKIAGLEKVYFVPERRPQHHVEPEHYVHRSVMLRRALEPYEQFSIFELPDARLTSKSLTRVLDALPSANYSLLTTASELLWHEGELPSLYHRLHLVIAVTSHAQMAEVLSRLTNSKRPLGNLTFVDIGTDHISSAEIRSALQQGKQTRGILPSVWRYARKQWLYLPPIYRKNV
jgi:nicotinate-nucleotide adenylyltransferase